MGTTAPRKAAKAKMKGHMCDKIIDAPIQFIFAMYFVSISLKAVDFSAYIIVSNPLG